MGTLLLADGAVAVRHFHTSASWIEGVAIDQAAGLAALGGVTALATMPDLHPGKYGPVGTAMLADRLHPRIVGSDIGCGMAFFRLDLERRKLRLDRVAERLTRLERPLGADEAAARREAFGLAPSAHDGALGSIGGGNHFCELQGVDAILDAEAAAAAGIVADGVHLLVHSGSRGLGAEVFRQAADGGAAGLDPDGADGAVYLAGHDHALAFAALNRLIVAERAAEALRAEMTALLDRPHNFAERTAAGILHRKGAAPADRGLVPIPGSRASPSYLVAPTLADPGALASLAHGAGRRFDRSSMAGRVGRRKSDLDRLVRNPYGGHVVCTDRVLLVEEAPEAYKSAEAVVADLVHFGLVRPVARLVPLVTFKTARPDRERLRREADRGTGRRSDRTRERPRDPWPGEREGEA